MFLSENVIFRGLRLSLRCFGQQAPESSVSQLQNCVSTSSIPPFIVDLSTFKDYPMGILEGVKGKPCKWLTIWAETAVHSNFNVQLKVAGQKHQHGERKGRKAKTKAVLKPLNQEAKLRSMQNLIF